MCIIFWATNTDGYALVLAANRDEFLARPTTSAAWHTFPPSASPETFPSPDGLPPTAARTLSGLDLSAGGTWLGLSIPEASVPPASSSTAVLKLSSLTNFTETPAPPAAPQPSRGALVRDFLASPPGVPATEYLERLRPVLGRYAGFNLLCGELTRERGFEMAYATNRGGQAEAGRPVPGVPGGKVIGLSNSSLDAGEDPDGRWPKVTSGCGEVERLLEQTRGKGGADLVEGLWRILSTSHPTPVTHRSHLRHTILIRPAYFTPSHMYMPPAPLPFPPPAVDARAPGDLPPPEELGQEGRGGAWYGTRVQTIVLIKKTASGYGVTFIERDGYLLGDDGRPRWSGEEHKYQFEL